MKSHFLVLYLLFATLCILPMSCDKEPNPETIDYREQWVGRYQQGQVMMIVSMTEVDSILHFSCGHINMQTDRKVEENGEYDIWQGYSHFTGYFHADSIYIQYAYPHNGYWAGSNYNLKKLPEGL